jgi:hypothetical protein
MTFKMYVERTTTEQQGVLPAGIGGVVLNVGWSGPLAGPSQQQEL